jgi:transcriptional regulator with XRE-family HTH domain
MDLGLRQKDAARQLGVSADTIRNWEVGRARPALRQWPKLIEFLGYVPFPAEGTLGDRLRTYRRLEGLSQKRLAAGLRIDPSALARWETGVAHLTEDHWATIGRILGSHPPGGVAPGRPPRHPEPRR